MAEYISTLDGQQMDSALLDMANHTSEAWAVGKRNGVDVPPTDEAYHNSAKYYAEHIAETGHPPYIGDNGNWYVWDGTAMAYVDSGVKAEGVDGRGITSITKTGTSGLVDTYTILFDDGTQTTFTVTNGAKGDTGEDAEILLTEYGVSSSAAVQPTSWQSSIPTVQGGQFLWTRYTWNSGNYSYICTRYGIDGSGSGDMSASDYDPDDSVKDAGGIAPYVEEEISTIPVVSVSETGTATDEVQYIIIDGVEKKLAGGGGFAPQIVVTCETGSTVTCHRGSTTLTATEVSGTWTFDIPEYGTWTITAVKGTKQTSATVSVVEVKQYSITVEYTKVYGIVKSYNDGGTVWTRTGDSETFTATAGIGTSGYYSDFDNCYPWSQMKRETIGSDVMVKIPKFWYKRMYNGVLESIQIANMEYEDFEIHPLFKPANTELDYVMAGAYETSSGHASKSGVAPLVNQTRAQFRTGARNKGTGWGQFDACLSSALQMLYLVEFADYNSQAKVGRGYCDGNSAAINTGSCDALYNAGVYSGRPSGTDGKTGVMYRGIENQWGNVWKWEDGINVYGATMWVCKDPSKYADDTSTNYTQLGYTTYTTAQWGYISRLGLDNNNPWAMFPSAWSGSETTYVTDGIYGTGTTNAWRVCVASGSWADASCDGFFTVVVDNASSYSSPSRGGRLLYRPV